MKMVGMVVMGSAGYGNSGMLEVNCGAGSFAAIGGDMKEGLLMVMVLVEFGEVVWMIWGKAYSSSGVVRGDGLCKEGC